MKRIIAFVSSFALLSGLLILPATALAQNDPSDPLRGACNAGVTTNSDVCKNQANNGENPITGPNGMIVKASQIIAILTGIACTITIIISGIRYVTSTGDPQAVNSAKNAILYALVGVVVASIAPFIVSFVISKL